MLVPKTIGQIDSGIIHCRMGMTIVIIISHMRLRIAMYSFDPIPARTIHAVIIMTAKILHSVVTSQKIQYDRTLIHLDLFQFDEKFQYVTNSLSE